MDPWITVERCGDGDALWRGRCPQWRSKGSRFTLGVWGLRVCSLDVAFASATVRNRPRDPRVDVPMGSSAKGVTFGGFTCGFAPFRMAGVALCDMFCVASAKLLRLFRKMSCSFVAGAFVVAGAAL